MMRKLSLTNNAAVFIIAMAKRILSNMQNNPNRERPHITKRL